MKQIILTLLTTFVLSVSANTDESRFTVQCEFMFDLGNLCLKQLERHEYTIANDKNAIVSLANGPCIVFIYHMEQINQAFEKVEDDDKNFETIKNEIQFAGRYDSNYCGPVLELWQQVTVETRNFANKYYK